MCDFKVISVTDTIETVIFRTGQFIDESSSIQQRLQYSLEYSKIPEGITEADEMWPDETFALAGFKIILSRNLLPHIMNTFLPSMLIVFTSFIRENVMTVSQNAVVQ